MGFYVYANYYMPILFENARLLNNRASDVPEDSVLFFLIPRAINNIVQNAILETEAAWKVMNKELEKFKLQLLSKCQRQYDDLDLIRNKIAAHRFEVSAATDKYEKWHQENYGDLEKTLALITAVATEIKTRFEDLACENDFLVRQSDVKEPLRLTTETVDALIRTINSTNP
jgi:hypothetical protein